MSSKSKRVSIYHRPEALAPAVRAQNEKRPQKYDKIIAATQERFKLFYWEFLTPEKSWSFVA